MPTANLTAAVVSNKIVWKNDTKSMRTAFKALDTYKSKVNAIKSQMNNIGNIKLKVTGLSAARAQINSLSRTANVNVNGGRSTRSPTGVGGISSSIAASRDAAAKARLAAEKKEDRILRFSLTPAMQKLTEAERRAYVLRLKSTTSARALRNEIVRIQSEVRVVNQLQARSVSLMNRQGFAANRMVGSMKQLAGGYLSVYTLIGGIANTAKVSMDFQKVESGMVAVSANSKEARQNLEFVRGTARKLGADLVQTSKGFTQLLAAGQGKMALSDMKELTTGVLETSTVLGLTTDDTTGAIRSLVQMMSKGQVMSKQAWTFS